MPQIRALCLRWAIAGASGRAARSGRTVSDTRCVIVGIEKVGGEEGPRDALGERSARSGTVAGDAGPAGLRWGGGRRGEGDRPCYQRPVRPGGQAEVVGGLVYEP